ncbi:hypothetical protein K440DRAFT_637052 [Wilcoxina mikolae CBS 423.85]|nr:hypothetical protein K440DRAFT_637052 [Wilcoxina mikolae CBS 423.85]
MDSDSSQTDIYMRNANSTGQTRYSAQSRRSYLTESNTALTTWEIHTKWNKEDVQLSNAIAYILDWAKGYGYTQRTNTDYKRDFTLTRFSKPSQKSLICTANFSNIPNSGAELSRKRFHSFIHSFITATLLDIQSWELRTGVEERD